MKHIIFLSLLVAGTNAYADSCVEMEAMYKSMPSHADELIAKRVDFKLPSHTLERFQSRACAIVSFYVDGSGSANDLRVVAYSPSRGVGRAALETLRGYEFVPGDYKGRLFVLMLRFNRFELKD